MARKKKKYDGTHHASFPKPPPKRPAEITEDTHPSKRVHVDDEHDGLTIDPPEPLQPPSAPDQPPIQPDKSILNRVHRPQGASKKMNDTQPHIPKLLRFVLASESPAKIGDP
ncbi:hypothetical protein GALMADRAFT_134091 [Galerina marginata CBS 339.88]|uniref:Uncharacterized protein n=1 Tax=Galerina marginata (strain CBS 339.88) TaxID=685588 RepID=A0A067TH93_GALM3|nr:hypothetical protein GALMADRAFT_134091 [Galerina marginata CBS 339.88]